MRHLKRPITHDRRSGGTGRRRLARRTAYLFLIAGVCSLLVPGLASAAPPSALSDPTSAQYDATVNVNGGGNLDGGGSTPTTSSSTGLQKHVVGGLPFTGVDLLALAAIAVALTSAGFALRRLSAPRYRA
jgi:hypothetical protein